MFITKKRLKKLLSETYQEGLQTGFYLQAKLSGKGVVVGKALVEKQIESILEGKQ